MNTQNLLGQLMNSTNPIQMLMGNLNPQQKQAVNLFQNKPSNEQAQEIANICNQKGITKEQLQSFISAFRR